MVSNSKEGQTGPEKARVSSAKPSKKTSRKPSGRSSGNKGSRPRNRNASVPSDGNRKPTRGHSRKSHSQTGGKRRILWIPGLGADRRMYGPLQRSLDRIMPGKWEHHFIDFPDKAQSLANVKSLQDLAEVTLENSIQPLQTHHKESRPYYDTVVGVSMGGMLAQVLVGQNLLHTENLILISTAYRGKDLRQPFLAFARIPTLLPGFLRSLVQWIIGKAYPLFRKNVAEAQQFAEMFLQFPQKIFFDAPIWIKKWNGEQGLQATLAMKPLPSDSQSVRVFRIHGTSDPLLSYKKIKDRIHLDLVIQKGSHIVFATHSDTIAEDLRAILDSESTLPDYWLPDEQATERSSGSQKRPRKTGQAGSRQQDSAGKKEAGPKRNDRGPQVDSAKGSNEDSKPGTRNPSSRRRQKQQTEDGPEKAEKMNGAEKDLSAGTEERTGQRRRRPRRRKKQGADADQPETTKASSQSAQENKGQDTQGGLPAKEKNHNPQINPQGESTNSATKKSSGKGRGGRRRPRRSGKKNAASP